MSYRPPKSIATHLHLPGWWVRAYDAAVLAEGSTTGAMEQACLAGVAPALTSLELNALAMVLGGLQQQLLEGATGDLVINSEEHLKHAGTAARHRRFIFEKIVQLLAGVRLLSPGGDGILASYSPFYADKWRRLGGSPEFEISLTLAPLGPELLLGLSDAHLDLVRFARGESEGVTMLRGQPPLTLWRSIWLELAGYEQLLYLRLERSMQWEFRWLQLEGIFGLPLAELFAGIDLPEQRGAELGGELAKRLKCLARLGRRLVDHGFLTPAVADHYLAIGGDSGAAASGLTMVWQASRERLAAVAGSAYCRAACESLRGRLAGIAPALLRLCLPALVGSEPWRDSEALWQRLSSLPLPASSTPLDAQPGQVFAQQALFFEYALRGQAAGPWPLPPGLAAGPLGELTRDLKGVDLLERWQRFCALVEDDAELPRALREDPLMTIASQASRLMPEFAQTAARLLAAPAPCEAAGEVKPRLITPAVAAAPAVDAPRRQSAVSGALASRMLKIASDELAKMRAGGGERYQEIKKAYLETLDETSRRLLLDVQKRIQPTMFEEQLRQRLVRYMVENPGAWRSAEAGKTSYP